MYARWRDLWAAGWFGPIPFPLALGRRILGSCRHLDACLSPWWVWCGLGALLGTLPVGIDYLCGLSTHRLATALLATPLLMAAAARDREGCGLAFLAFLFGAHSALTIALARADPTGLAPVCPGGLDYWEQSRSWITTGASKEYDVGWWLPAHLQMIAVVVLLTYTSFGLIPLWQGLYEVDLMNFYVGQFLAHAAAPSPGAVLAWHPWSLCRGAGFLFLTFEVVNLSLARLARLPLSTGRRRLRRWATGLGLLALDAIVKYVGLEPVRQVLAAILG